MKIDLRRFLQDTLLLAILIDPLVRLLGWQPAGVEGVSLAITGLEIAAIIGAVGAVGASVAGRSRRGPAFGSKSVDLRFKTALRSGFDLFQNRLTQGIPGFEGDLTAPLEGAEQGVLGLIPGATGTLQSFLDPEFGADLLMRFEQARRPFVERQIAQARGGAREAEALGGSIFSTGRIERENRAAGDVFANEQAIAAPIAAQLALQGPQLQLGALQQIPGLLQAAGLPRQIEQDKINRELAEFIRTDPGSLLPLLVGLAGGSAQAPIITPGPLQQAAPALAGLSGGLFQIAAGDQQNKQLQQQLDILNAFSQLGGVSGASASGTGGASSPAPRT